MSRWPRAFLPACLLAAALAAAGPAAADDTVPCERDSLARLQQMIKKSRGKVSGDTTAKAERQYELARKAHAEGKGRLCSLALKKGFAVIEDGAR